VIWFTADYHLGHGNIIKYCNRPFRDVEHMNQTIITRHNARVGQNDIVYHLGDFCFKQPKAHEWERKLNGKIVHVLGNHDQRNDLKEKLEKGVVAVGQSHVFVAHRPQDVDHRYRLAFCGHVHAHWRYTELRGRVIVNVGVDAWDFYPRKFDELMQYKRIGRRITRGL